MSNTTENNNTPATTDPPAKTKQKKEMSKETLKALHEALKKAKYMVGTDEKSKVYGAATEQAVRYFQADNGLYVTGQLNDKTAEKLNIKQ